MASQAQNSARLQSAVRPGCEFVINISAAIAEGPATPDLAQLAKDHPDDWINLWIDGTGPEVKDIDRKGMPQFGQQLTPQEIGTIVDYLKTLP